MKAVKKKRTIIKKYAISCCVAEMTSKSMPMPLFILFMKLRNFKVMKHIKIPLMLAYKDNLLPIWSRCILYLLAATRLSLSAGAATDALGVVVD